MVVTINVNGLSLCHRGSDGVSIATLPDVCWTPPIPVPVPYPNISRSKDLEDGTVTVSADGGNSIAVQGSKFACSTGDEPGTAGGVVSGVNRDESTWLTWSPDVRYEGRNACRLTDKKLQNRANTVDAAGLLQAFLAPGAPGTSSAGGKKQSECAAKWEAQKQETEALLAKGNGDALRTNEIISGKYADLYLADSRYQWAGMAAFASKQVGCAMRDAAAHGANPTLGGPVGEWEKKTAAGAKDALARGNQTLFRDAYTAHRFHQEHGNAELQRCGKELGLAPDLLSGFDRLEQGDIRGSTMDLAKHEQHDVLQKAAFDDPSLSRALGVNRSLGKLGPLGRSLGGKPEKVALGAGCDAAHEVTLDGGADLRVATDRVTFARKMASAFEGLATKDARVAPERARAHLGTRSRREAMSGPGVLRCWLDDPYARVRAVSDAALHLPETIEHDAAVSLDIPVQCELTIPSRPIALPPGRFTWLSFCRQNLVSLSVSPHLAHLTPGSLVRLAQELEQELRAAGWRQTPMLGIGTERAATELQTLGADATGPTEARVFISHWHSGDAEIQLSARALPGEERGNGPRCILTLRAYDEVLAARLRART